MAIAYPYQSKLDIWDIENRNIVYTYQPGGYTAVSITSDKLYLIGAIGTCLVKWPFLSKLSEINQELIQATITYPNPVHNIFNLEFNLTIPNLTNIDLIDLTGNTVKVIDNKFLNPGNHQYSVDISELPVGVYTLRIISGNFSFTSRIIKNQ